MPRSKTIEVEGAGGELEAAETGALLAEIARLYFVDRQSLEAISKSLSRRFSRKFDPSRVSRTIARARALGVVRFSIDAHAAIQGEVVPSLSEDLRWRFNTRGKIECVAIVPIGRRKRVPKKKVDTGSTQEHQQIKFDGDHSNGIVDKKTLIEESISDSDVHYALAKYAAGRAVNDFKNEDVIAVCGGRAIYKFCEFVSRTPQDRDHILVVPLSGRIWSGTLVIGGGKSISNAARSQLLQRVLDADDAARVLASSFVGIDPAFRQIGLPLYASSEPEARSIMAGNCAALPDGSWRDKEIPTRAYIGVGILDPATGHRIRIFHDEQTNAYPRKSVEQKARNYLHRVENELTGAIKCAEKAKTPYPGDIGNRLFTVLPTPIAIRKGTACLDENPYREIAGYLDAINSRSVVMQWRHLRQIPYVCVIAGGVAKLPALWTLLLPELLRERKLDPEYYIKERFVSDLVIDEKSGDELFECYRIFAHDLDMQRWYVTMVKSLMLFIDTEERPSAEES